MAKQGEGNVKAGSKKTASTPKKAVAAKVETEETVEQVEQVETLKAEKKPVVEVEPKFTLPNVKVHVKPIVRAGRWLPEGHSGSFMYDHTVLGIQVPIDGNSGRLKNPLTKEEQEFFENDAGLDLEKGDLNPYKKKDNYWVDFRIALRKSDEIITDKSVLMTLDLSDPMQYLEYKVLMCNTSQAGGLVAPSWQERKNSGTYKVALVHEGQQNYEKVKRADLMKKAYKYLAKIDASEEEMFDFLTIYYLENGKSKRPSEDSTKSFYYSELQDIIDNDLDGFVSIVDDAKDYDYKLLVHRGLKIGALVMQGANLETVDGIPVGNSLYQAVQWFKDDRHQNEYLTLKNQIELAK